MNTTTTHQDQHPQIRLLLPWYVNQTLEQHERLMVDKHIRQCLLCRRELVSLQRLGNAVAKASDREIAAAASFAGIASKLSPRNTAPFLARPRQSLSHHLGRYAKSNAVRYAMAASLVLGLLPLGLRILPVGPEDSYYTLSTARPEPSHAGDLRVVFAKSTSKDDIAAILKSLHAQPMGEANSVGALTLRLDNNNNTPNVAQALAALRSRQDVLLAEPVLQP